MTVKDILAEWLRERLLLFKDPEKYRSVMAARVVAFAVVTTVIVTVVLVFTGKINFDIGFVLGVFAIFISWHFFWSSERQSARQVQQLQEFLHDFRTESQKRFDQLDEQVDSIFKTGMPPTTPPPSPSTPAAEEAFAVALSEIIKPGPKQIIIALNHMKNPITNGALPLEYSFELGNNISRTQCFLSGLIKELAEIKMVQFDPETGKVRLSDRGKKFAEWMIAHGQKASYFECPMLGSKWGTPSERFIALIGQWRKEEESRKANKHVEGAGA